MERKIKVEAYRDPWSGEYYCYKGDGKCPICGGNIVICDTFIVCVADGLCTYNADIIDEDE